MLGGGALVGERGTRAKTLKWNELEVFKEQEKCPCGWRVVKEMGAGVSRGQDPEIIMKGALQTSVKKPNGYVFPGAE